VRAVANEWAIRAGGLFQAFVSESEDKMRLAGDLALLEMNPRDSQPLLLFRGLSGRARSCAPNWTT